MKYIAHRGLTSRNSNENTDESLSLGLASTTIEGIECDVRLSKDNKLVIIHDADIDRVSNGKGLVKDYTLEELKKFNYGTKVKHNSIITVEELLAKKNNQKLLLIELKDEGERNNILVEKVLEIVNIYPEFNIYLQSFSKEILNMLKGRTKHPLVILINENNYQDINLDYDGYSINYQSVKRHDVTEKIKAKKTIFIWTVDSIWTLRRLKLQLFGYLEDIYIISNNPYKLM